MVVTASALRVLHRLHKQLSDLRERLDRGPKRIRARELEVDHLKQGLAHGEDQSRQARMTADKKQLELKSSEDKTQDWKTRLNACSTNKEYQALLDQIAAAEMAASVLSDEILEVLERIDDLDEKVTAAKKKVATVERELDQAQQEVAEASIGIREDTQRLERKLAIAEGDLPNDFRTDYDRVVRKQGADALAQVDESYCGGCFQQITPNMVNNLALGRPVFCLACGRLLYLSEDAMPGKKS